MRAAVALVCSAVLVGCASGPETPPTPMPTDGPNQVVIYVPAMT